MLKKWIEEIREHPVLYKTDSWKYHISGNVIEISILPAHLKDRYAYRCAVIAVGQVLKALSCYIEKQKSNFHIQSFPSLENPAVVASVRIDENRGFLRKPVSAKNNSLKSSKPEVAVQKLAKQYQLDIQEIQEPGKIQGGGINSSDFKLWFILYSAFNNPFTWLNIGYWKESIQNDCADLLPPREFTILDFCEDHKEEHLNVEVPNNKYLQCIIGINSTIPTN